MARSSYVYVVQDTENAAVLGGFTVKHELQTWLDSYGRDGKDVFRFRDGKPHMVALLEDV